MKTTLEYGYNNWQNQQGLWYAVLVTDHKRLYLQKEKDLQTDSRVVQDRFDSKMSPEIKNKIK